MDNTYKPDVWQISRRFLFYYFPIYLCYRIISLMMGLTVQIQYDLDIAFPWFSSIIGSMIIILSMYLFIIVPVILFKPQKTASRRMVMLLFTLIFSAILSYINIKLKDSPHPLDTALIIKDTLNQGCSDGILICLLFFIEEKQFITINRIATERNIKLKNEKMITETHLRLLQAQIEPHFLFNTLTSILVLSEKEPQKAKIMHDNFMQYLEATLVKTRASVTTVGQDIELIKAYLEIFKVRMEKRLQYSIEADDEVIDQPFPSMLIQPVIENAIKHGLEPKIDGGVIRIKVTKQERNRLRWEIEDTGLGMSDEVDIGTGLSNIMERIKTLYGKEGCFSLKNNKPSGVKATLEVPYA